MKWNMRTIVLFSVIFLGFILFMFFFSNIFDEPLHTQQALPHMRVSGNGSQINVEKSTEAVEKFFEENDYEVRRGELYFFKIKDCMYLKTCYGNNPSSPYGLYLLPPLPEEKNPSILSFPGYEGLSATWRLRPDEAIIFIGKTPPRVTYFSFRSYLFSRSDNNKTYELFASLGNSLNHLMIATSGNPDNPDDVFDKSTVVITTADAAFDSYIRSVLPLAGIDERIANTDVIPSDIVRMGSDAHADVFTMLMRSAIPDNKTDVETYYQNPDAVILRITPLKENPIDPFPTPILAVGGTGVSEKDIFPDIEEWRDDLTEKVKNSYPDYSVREINYIDSENIFGFNCIENFDNFFKLRSYCFGDNLDALYYIAVLPFKLDKESFVMVIGVDHAALGRTTYDSHSVYYLEKNMGVASAATKDFRGSAEKYSDHFSNKYLYAYKISRECHEEDFCLTIPEEFPGVPEGESMRIVGRSYLEPETNVRPNPDEIIAPRYFLFMDNSVN